MTRLLGSGAPSRGREGGEGKQGAKPHPSLANKFVIKKTKSFAGAHIFVRNVPTRLFEWRGHCSRTYELWSEFTLMIHFRKANMENVDTMLSLLTMVKCFTHSVTLGCLCIYPLLPAWLFFHQGRVFGNIVLWIIKDLQNVFAKKKKNLLHYLF